MLSIVMLINRTGSMVFPFLGVYMGEQLGFDLKTTGMVLSCFGIGAMVGSFLGGWITDKIGEYPVQTISLLLSVPLFLLYPYFTTPVALGTLLFIQSVVSEVFRPANSVAITKYAKPENLTRAFSLNRMAINLGFSIGPAMAGVLAAISYNLLFWSNAVFVGIAGIAYILFFRTRYRTLRRDKKAQQVLEEPVVTAPVKDTFKTAYFDWKFWIFCILCTSFSVCFFQLMNTLPMFYQQGVGLSKQEIGLLMGLNGIVVVVFEMLLVHISEHRFTLGQTMLIGTLLCGISYGMLGFEPNMMILAISMSLLSLGEILVLPFMSTITALRSGKYNQGSYMGMNGMSVSIAFVISPILGSYLAAQYGFSALWIGTAILLILTAYLFYIFIPRMIPNTKTSH